MDLWMHLWMHCAMVLVHFLMHWCSYKQLHWRNAHCLCMVASAYGQLFKANMQQLIRRYASQFGHFLGEDWGIFFPSPVEVLPYRRDGIAVIVRWVGYSDWSSVCGFHALPFSTLRLDRVPATISYPQKSILHPYTWSNANGQSPGSTWTNAPPFRSFPPALSAAQYARIRYASFVCEIIHFLALNN